MSANNDYYSKAILVGLEPATSESLVPDLTTTPPSHRVIFTNYFSNNDICVK